MKNRNKELDVDFIGGQKPLTKEEEAIISAFINARKKKKGTPTVKTKQKINKTVLQPA